MDGRIILLLDQFHRLQGHTVYAMIRFILFIGNAFFNKMNLKKAKEYVRAYEGLMKAY